MSTLALAPTLFEPEGGEPTLDDVLVGAWEGLTAHRTVDCPVCGGEMVSAAAAGRCGSCGSELS
jgi:tRNA(Ile2) C34 agmatinyltransferase TiaS